jgi:predicted ATPase with chaperone activity
MNGARLRAQERLVLDELPEFGRAVLESLRASLELGRVTVARAKPPRHLSRPFPAGRGD